MKRRCLGFATLLVCLVVMFSAAGIGYAVTTTEYDISQLQQPTAALDLVILMDNSASMYISSLDSKSDPYSYRYDAASIMLNMCEAQGTYAAVYEFTNVPKAIGSGKLESIDMEDSVRSKLTNLLSERVQKTCGQEHNKGENGQTFLGTGLQKAVEVLDSGKIAREEEGRAPVILILADGNCDTVDQSMLETAKDNCKKKGYKIYTVLLKGLENWDRQTLSELAKETGGRAFELDDATELPRMFAQVFADQTGAELTYNTKEPKQIEGNLWEVEFPIPNTAVTECNIMIPTAGLTNIELYRPNSDSPINDNDASDNVYRFTCGITPLKDGKVAQKKKIQELDPRFIQYKIMAPLKKERDLGIWKMRFNADNAQAAKNVSITVVFDYNLKLKTNFATEGNEITCNKGDTIDLIARFYTSNDQSSKDETLYQGKKDENAESGIDCTAYLFFNDNLTIFDNTPAVKLEAKQQDCWFEKMGLSIADFGLDKGTYKSGDYYILVKAEGDGMIRSADPIILHVVNQAPEVYNTHNGIKLRIEDPVAGMEKSDETEIHIDQYLRDPDGDFDVKSISNGEIGDTTIVKLSLDKSQPPHAKATITTTGNVGDTVFKITMTDHENAENTLEVPLSVKSVMNELKNGYTLELKASEPQQGGPSYQKKESVALTVKWERTNDGNPDFALENYQPSIKLFQIETGKDDPTLLEEGMINGATHSVTMEGEDGGVYTYYAELYANDQLVCTTDLKQLSTENKPPRVIADSVWSNSALIGCEKFPDDVLGHKNTEPWIINFDQMIEDPNGNGITFVYATDPIEQDIVELEPIKDGENLTALKITPKAEGTIKILITATDDYSVSEPGKLENQEYTVTVTDQHAITMKYIYMIFAGIILVCIVLKIIRSLTRPKFRNTSLEVLVNNVIQNEYPLTTDIKKKLMSSYVPHGFKFTSVNGSALIIKPARDGATIEIKKPKKLNGVTMQINGKPIGKRKKVQLSRTNSVLSAVYGGEIMAWKLKYTGGPKPGAGARKKPNSGKPNAAGRQNNSGRPNTPYYHT